MIVLVADKVSEDTIRELEAMELTVRYQPDLTKEQLPGVIEDVNTLVVRSTKVTDETINAASALSLIVRAGAGVNTIDVATASARGHLRHQLPRKEQRGRRRTGDWPPDRMRSLASSTPPRTCAKADGGRRSSASRRGSAGERWASWAWE